MRAREEWSDVGWHEEEVVGQTRERRVALDGAASSIGLGVASLLVALVAGAAWVWSPWPSGAVLLLAVVSALVGLGSPVVLWRRRVRSVAALVVAALAGAGGVGTLGLVAEEVVVLLAG